MNALVDTNIWLDIFLNRAPFVDTSSDAVSILDAPMHELYVGATTVTTIFYLVKKARSQSTAISKIHLLLSRCHIAPVNKSVLLAALETSISDFEDAVLTKAADSAGLHAIITRNPDDFSDANLRIYTPSEFISALR